MANHDYNLEINDQYKRYIHSYLDSNNYNTDSFKYSIHPNDEMFYNATLPGCPNQDVAYIKYLESGKRSMDVVKQIAKFKFLNSKYVPSILEFACGHGRLTRFLINEIPKENIWTSDIYEDAVKWQNEYFGVTSINSHVEPEKFQCDRKFSIIVVGSLFSHLPDDLFKRWYKKLYSLLDDEGMLVFSVRDEHIRRRGEVLDEKGFSYSRVSESDSLSHDNYGLTHVTEEYVKSVMDNYSGEDIQYVKFRKGLYENQDLYVVSRKSNLDLSKFTLHVTPMGGLNKKIDNGSLLLSGWGIDFNADEQIEWADLFVNNQLVDSTRTTVHSAPDKILAFIPNNINMPVQWGHNISVNEINADDILTCRLRNKMGLECLLYTSLD
jgi:trans-aconitate methyltransferase